MTVLEDQERNRRNDDNLIDDMWDESIKVREPKGLTGNNLLSKTQNQSQIQIPQ